MADEAILIETDEFGVAVVTLNRPAKRNAVSLAMWQRLAGIFNEFDARPDVRGIVLTGAAGHFSAGADISEFASLRSTAADIEVYEHAADGATRAVRDCGKPTFAAVHGYGLGGGCGLALACDLRIGDASTRMGIPAAQRGVVYGTLDCELLLRQVGLSNAKLVLFSARIFSTEACLSMRLLDLAGDNALETAIAQARGIAANAPLSVAGGKKVLEALVRGEQHARAAEIRALIEGAASSADYREATAAFIEKRPARFQGR
jgi:enoyl-CoA hydratase/carnithine racemase